MLCNRPLRLSVVCCSLILAVTASPAMAQKTGAKKPPARSAAPASKAATPKTARPAAKNKLDLAYISSRALAAVVLHPQTLLTTRQVQSMPIEVAEAALRQESGIELLKIQEVIVLVSLNFPAPPTPAFIVRFTEACDQEKITERLGTGDSQKIGDVSAYRTKGPQPLLFAFANDRTLLVAADEALTEMLTVKKPTSPLLDRLGAIDAAEPLSAVVVIDPIRPLLQGALAQLPPLPPEYQQFTQLADLLAAIELHLAGGEQLMPSLVLEGTGQGAAAQINQLLDNAIDLANAAVAQQMAQAEAQNPGPVSEAMTHYVKRMLKTTLEAIDRQQMRNRLTLKIDANPDATFGLATNGVLIALLLPAVQSARDAGRRNISMNNLKQIGLAMQNHADVYKAFPARARFKDGKPLLSWRVAILPFVEELELYKQFHLDEPWDSEHNRKLIEKMPPVYINPKLDPKLVREGKTNYLAPTGPGTMFDGETQQTFATIKDGTSFTVTVVEANADRAVIWTKPDDLEFDPDNALDGLGDFQPGGITALFADGHVSLLPSTIDAGTLSNLFNPNDGQRVNVP